MCNDIYRKLRIQEDIHAKVINPPKEYLSIPLRLNFSKSEEGYGYVHWFIRSKKEFTQKIDSVKSLLTSKNGILGILSQK